MQLSPIFGIGQRLRSSYEGVMRPNPYRIFDPNFFGELPPPFLESSRWEGVILLFAVFRFARVRYAGALRLVGFQEGSPNSPTFAYTTARTCCGLEIDDAT